MFKIVHKHFVDSWLKQIKEKPKKKPKSMNGSPFGQDETSMDALIAAGLNVSSLAWNTPSSALSTAVKATPIAESSGTSCCIHHQSVLTGFSGDL